MTTPDADFESGLAPARRVARRMPLPLLLLLAAVLGAAVAGAASYTLRMLNL